MAHKLSKGVIVGTVCLGLLVIALVLRRARASCHDGAVRELCQATHQRHDIRPQSDNSGSSGRSCQSWTAVQFPLQPPGTSFLRDFDAANQQDGQESGKQELEAMRAAVQQQRDLRASAARGEQVGLLVYSCDRGRLCGGLGDRLKGIVSALYMAILTNRLLLVHWDDGSTRIGDFLWPQALDWTPSAELLGPSCAKGPVAFFDESIIDHIPAGLDLTTCDLRQRWVRHRVVLLHTNLDLSHQLQVNHKLWAAMPRALAHLQHSIQIFRGTKVALDILFRPSSAIANAAAAIRRGWFPPNLDGSPSRPRLVGLQYRVGDSQQGWGKDQRYSPEKISCMLQALANLQAAIRGHSAIPAIAVFVTSDSDDVAEEAVQRLRAQGIVAHTTMAILGRASHLDRVRAAHSSLLSSPKGQDDVVLPTCLQQQRAHLRTFLDWMLLLTSDAMLITESGFCQLAASWNCVPALQLLSSQPVGQCEFRHALGGRRWLAFQPSSLTDSTTLVSSTCFPTDSRNSLWAESYS